MGFDQFLAAPEYSITIVTYRDVFQSKALEESMFSEEYQKLSAVIKMDESDIKKVGVSEGDSLTVKNGSGQVNLRVEKSGYEEPHEGIAYMPNSPWSNALVSADTGGSGVPKYKAIEVKVSKAKTDEITKIDDLI